MSTTKNECEIVNRLSRKVEKELAENMDKVNVSLAEINEKLEDVALIDDTTASTTSTYSSEKIEELISDIPTTDIIDDTTASTTTTYSSEKIEDLIDDIPGVNVIDDTTSSLTTTYSSDKIDDLIENIPGADVIDDTTSSLTTTYSSNKINNLVDAKTSINDTTSSLTTTYSSDKINNLVDAKTSINDTTSSLTTTYSSDKIDDLIENIPGADVIDDTTSSLTTTYSSNKINNLVDAKTSINDTTSSLTTTYSSDKIDDLIENIPGADVIDDTVTTTTKTWSSSKIRTEIDAGGGGGSGFEPKYTMTKQFNTLSTSYVEKINTLTDFSDINIEAGKMYLVCWGVYKRGTGGVDSMNANFKLEILSNNYVQRSIEVNQPNGSNEPIFGTSIQPFTLLVNSSATNIGFKLYGNNANGEKSTWFDFVMNIYELGNIN